MTTDVTVRWTTPTRAVDERITVSPTGEARLLVLAPQRDADLVGEFLGRVGADEYAALAAPGPRWSIDPGYGTSDGDAVLAAQVADRCRARPVAASLFVLRAGGSPGDGRRPFTIGVIGRGQRASRFLLDLDHCRIRFLAGGDVVAEQPLPPLAAGFMTGDAEGLGGVGQVATVSPDTLGAIALDLAVPADVTHAEIVLAGSWFPGDADGSAPPERFTARAVAELTD